MEINVQATLGQCDQFIGEDREQRVISVAIAPLRVNMNEDQDKLAIISGCNMWKSCYNAGCYYSSEARKKAQAGKVSLRQD